MQSEPLYAPVPMRWVGPIAFLERSQNQKQQESVSVPLATYESPLWPSTNRGAKVTRLIGGLDITVLRDCMTRSILLEAPSAVIAAESVAALHQRLPELAEIVSGQSHYARLIRVDPEISGRLLFLRFVLETGDAAGHNMVTQAADLLLKWCLVQYPMLQSVSVSGNYCVDKKVSAVNGLLGRGKHVIAEGVVSRAVCAAVLKTTPENIVNLHIKKNLTGGILAGSLRTANAHFANMLLGFYLATGQDVANIVEGSQGMVQAELQEGDLYFAVTLPNIIVGTVGNGKHHGFVQENLTRMGCMAPNAPGVNAKRLAKLVAATVWCGEISLLAAQTNPGELMRCHLAFERGVNTPLGVSAENFC